MGDSLVLSRPEFIMPFVFCSYCDYSLIDLIDVEENIEQVIPNLPENYKSYYLKLNGMIENSKNKQGSNIERVGLPIGVKALNKMRVNSRRIRKKYGTVVGLQEDE